MYHQDIPFVPNPREVSMRIRPFPLILAATVLCATLAFAEPRLLLEYPGGVPRVTLTGTYAGASYTVLRAPASGGDWAPITLNEVLCLGACSAPDPAAVPGASYLYRFDLRVPEGDMVRPVSYGPFPATISLALARPIGVSVFPNPGGGPATVELRLAGASGEAARGEAAIYDLAGRRVRLLHQGALARGLVSLAWDGRDERGQPLRRGVYLVRFAADGRQATARIVRL